MSEPQRATIHLRVLGEVQKVTIDVPPTPAAATDLLPAARSITNAVMETAIARSAAGGAPASCRRGCDACCHQVVGISAPEARRLAALVDGMPAERQAVIRRRFEQTLARVRASGVLDMESPDGAPVLLLKRVQGIDPYIDMALRYHRLHLPCPFLEEGACSIYEERPLICREYVVSSPAEHCGAMNFPAIEMIKAPVRLSDGLAEVTAALEKKEVVQIPLFAALAWAAMAQNAAPEPAMSGPELLMVLAKWVDRKPNVPLAERSQQA